LTSRLELRSSPRIAPTTLSRCV